MSLLLADLSSRIGPCTRCPSYRTETAFGVRRGDHRQTCHPVFGAVHAPTDATSALSGALFVAIYPICSVARRRGVSRCLPRAANRADPRTCVESIHRFGQHCPFHHPSHSSPRLLAAICTVAFS